MNEIGVIFDCDGVLADTETTAARVEIAYLGGLGLHYTVETLRAKFLGSGGATFRAALDAEHAAAFGRPMAERDFEGLITTVSRAVLQELAPVPGGPALALRVAGPKAVASSSGGAELQAKLKSLELWDAFAPHVFSAADVPLAKPAPDLFLAAGASLGLSPDRCRVIEDSPNGVKAALAAGMPVVGFAGSAPEPREHAKRLRDAGAQAVATSFEEVGGWLSAQGASLRAS